MTSIGRFKMTREETLFLFEKKEIQQILYPLFCELEEEFQEQKTVWIKQFCDFFSTICEEIIKRQEQGSLYPIRFLMLTMLRSNLIEQKYELPMLVLGESWWLEPNIIEVGQYDARNVFSYYTKFIEQLEQARKKYVGKTGKEDVGIWSQKQAMRFLRYIGRIAQSSILKVIEIPAFQKIKSTGKISLYVSEYENEAEWIYEERRKERTKQEWDILEQQLEEKKRLKLCFQDLRFSYFPKRDFSGGDFRFTNFKKSILKETSFFVSNLIGTIFTESDLEGTNFQGSLISEAHFEGCNLRKSTFRKSEANNGKHQTLGWSDPSYDPVSFRGADLTEADFRGSQLEHIDFTNACLKGTLFDPQQWDKLPLSAEQRQQAKVVNP